VGKEMRGGVVVVLVTGAGGRGGVVLVARARVQWEREEEIECVLSSAAEFGREGKRLSAACAARLSM
jgi:hypothetical protein